MRYGIVSGFMLHLMAAGRCHGSREYASGASRVEAADGFMSWEDEYLGTIIPKVTDLNRSSRRLSQWFAHAHSGRQGQ